jgi:hypothetical protein
MINSCAGEPALHLLSQKAKVGLIADLQRKKPTKNAVN